MDEHTNERRGELTEVMVGDLGRLVRGRHEGRGEAGSGLEGDR